MGAKLQYLYQQSHLFKQKIQKRDTVFDVVNSFRKKSTFSVKASTIPVKCPLGSAALFAKNSFGKTPVNHIRKNIKNCPLGSAAWLVQESPKRPVFINFPTYFRPCIKRPVAKGLRAICKVVSDLKMVGSFRTFFLQKVCSCCIFAL